VIQAMQSTCKINYPVAVVVLEGHWNLVDNSATHRSFADFRHSAVEKSERTRAVRLYTPCSEHDLRFCEAEAIVGQAYTSTFE